MRRINLLFYVIVALVLAGGSARAQTQHVVPIDWSRYDGMQGVKPGDLFGENLATLLQHQSRYMYDWIESQHVIETEIPEWMGTPVYYPAFSAHGYEQSVRPLAHIASSTAAMLKTGIFSSSIAGISESEALRRTELAIRGVAMTHRVNKASGYRWGQGLSSRSQHWQAAYWSAQAAEAAWMLWEDLSPQTQSAVARMVEFEANAFSNYTVPYWKTKAGSTNYTGDSKAEENAWNSRILAVAQAMMPNHPNVTAWRNKASELQVSAYTRQSDVNNNTIIDGKAVKNWINGYNTFNDGVVVNHSLLHPDYIAADGSLRGASLITVSLAGQLIPQSMVFNFDVIYHALTEVNFVPGTNPYGTGTLVGPGGTIYWRSVNGYEPELYYPQGTDWSTKLTDAHFNIDLIAEYLALDAGKGFDAFGWADARVQYLLDLQNRPGHDGNIYESGDWYADYRDTDAVMFQTLAQGWLQWWLMSNDQISPIGSNWGTVPEPATISLVAVLALTMRRRASIFRH